MSDTLGKTIYKLLKKYYYKWSSKEDKKYKILLSTPDEEFEDVFNSLWKNEHGKKEHGGYIPSVRDLDINPELADILPFQEDDGLIIFPQTGSNDKKFQKEYIRVGNKLLLKNDKPVMEISLAHNGGGKPAVLFAALLPLFNLSKRKVLTLYKTRDGKYHKDIIKDNSIVTCISNDKETVKGTTKKLQNIKKLIVYKSIYTGSAAEQALIGLLKLQEHSTKDIKLIFKGDKTRGATSCNKWFPIGKDNGIEIPIAYMADLDGKIYPNGI